MTKERSSMPYAKIVNEFEETIAAYSGAKFGIAVSSCTNALFLCCKFLGVSKVTIPKHTYPGVACSIIHAGGSIEFSDEQWKGAYELWPYKIIDSACRFKMGMYIPGTYYCLSFHIKKNLPIGRGGMILCDDELAAEWFRRARFDGRRDIPLKDDTITMLGWNMYLTKEQATRGLMLFEVLKNKDLPDLDSAQQGYPDLSQIEVYKCKGK